MNVKVYEVGPRDGLQSLPHTVPVEHRQELIKRLRIAGLNDIEEVSFVNPRVLPQMGDAEAVFSGQGAALVLNKRGFERAKAAESKSTTLFFLHASSFHSTTWEGATMRW